MTRSEAWEKFDQVCAEVRQQVRKRPYMSWEESFALEERVRDAMRVVGTIPPTTEDR